MDVFLTVLSGVTVFVLGQFVFKLVIEPWQRQRECIALIAHHLIYYANVYSNPGVGTDERNHEASLETRKLAAELTASCYRIPMYETFSKLPLFPSLPVVRDARSQLIGLSNSTKDGNPDHNFSRIYRIRKLLQIQDDE